MHVKCAQNLMHMDMFPQIHVIQTEAIIDENKGPQGSPLNTVKRL